MAALAAQQALVRSPASALAGLERFRQDRGLQPRRSVLDMRAALLHPSRKVLMTPVSRDTPERACYSGFA
jgi:hypothetical protein